MQAVIGDMGNLLAFRKDVRDALRDTPFTEKQRDEILLALTELGTNLFVHGPGGEIEVHLPAEGATPLRIRSRNLPGGRPPDLPGPPPVSPARGLGIGLSSLERLMDSVSVDPDGGAFVVTCEKWVPPCVRH